MLWLPLAALAGIGWLFWRRPAPPAEAPYRALLPASTADPMGQLGARVAAPGEFNADDAGAARGFDGAIALTPERIARMHAAPQLPPATHAPVHEFPALFACASDRCAMTAAPKRWDGMSPGGFWMPADYRLIVLEALPDGTPSGGARTRWGLGRVVHPDHGELEGFVDLSQLRRIS